MTWCEYCSTILWRLSGVASPLSNPCPGPNRIKAYIDEIPLPPHNHRAIGGGNMRVCPADRYRSCQSSWLANPECKDSFREPRIQSLCPWFEIFPSSVLSILLYKLTTNIGMRRVDLRHSTGSRSQAMINSGGTRQQPGLACEECRRRKARCDRVRPQCGICSEMGRNCVTVDQRSQRGPRKGQLKDLRSRVGEFQQCI